jgi:hypothetical protein
VPDPKQEELEGLTLSVYLYVVKKGKPVGPRDVVKGAHLSSPSVAYRPCRSLKTWVSWRRMLTANTF